ncbi:hypothetical protein [Microbacterium oleivorans]|uniref:hypothetical protein n=1 Tax=Microbacterium oleivorans TaxID=273677 RepID=UPI00080DA9F0|nr:hypothetical protein [Microbacterium oleivorans]
MRGRRLTWTIGGAGLIACGVAGILLSVTLGTSLTDVLAFSVDLLWAAAVLVFAIGTSSHDSVVARRPLGMITLALVALCPLLVRGVGLFQNPDDPTPLIPWAVTTFVPLALSLVAVVQIGRAGVVSKRWRWAPAVALGVSLACDGLSVVAIAGPDQATAVQFVGLSSALGVIGFLTRTLGLGIVALLAVASERPASVPVYSSPSEPAPGS